MPARFKILKTLGEGSMGRVVLAQDSVRGEKVALKILPKNVSEDDRKALENEVTLLSKISHPNLIRLFDYENDPELGPLLVMEVAEGRPFHEVAGSLPFDKLEDLFVQFCRGLHSLHARGFFHGDLKPPNAVISPDGRLKILDFGLGGIAGTAREDPAGTFIYMAPETFGGVRDAQSDLYALGIIFFEAVGGIYPYERGALGLDLKKKAPPLPGSAPAYFKELIRRLVRLNPEERPRSALSLIKYLNRHRQPAYPIAEESSSATFQKTPWVARPEEDELNRALHAWRTSGEVMALEIVGPKGIGRSRLLEEMQWRLKLDGVSVIAVDASRMEGTSEAPAGGIILLKDLHEWPEEALPRLRLAMRREIRSSRRHLFLLEYDADAADLALASLAEDVPTWGKTQTIRLKDLDGALSLKLAQQASADWDPPPTASLLKKAVANSGGRPLLLIENLRALRNGREPELSRDLAQAVRARVEGLSPSERQTLALVATHPQPVTSREAALLPQTSWDSLIREGYLLRSDGALALTHSSLRRAYLDALAPAERQRAHQTWLEILKIPALVLHHAVGAKDEEAATNAAIPGLGGLFANGEFTRTLALCDGLMTFVTDPEQRAVVLAYRAPIHFRLGHFEQALKDYNVWKDLRTDRDDPVLILRHALYTAQVLLGWGRKDEARKRLQACITSLKTPGEKAKPHLARAALLLASIEEKTSKARALLEDAASNCADDPILEAERKLKLGELEQKEERYGNAKSLFESALNLFEKGGNTQAQALAWNALGMLAREQGALATALEAMNRAVTLAESGGELLQLGRYRENRALVAMDADDYGASQHDMAEAGDILTTLGDTEDRILLEEHRKEFAALFQESPPLPHFAHQWPAWKSVQKPLLSVTRSVPDEKLLNEVFAALKSVESPRLRALGFNALAAALKKRNLDGFSQVFARFAKQEYTLIHQRLPEELKMDFEKTADVKSLDQSLAEALKTAVSDDKATGGLSEERFRRFCEINRKIALKNELSDILGDVLETAIGLTGAERGFVVLRNEGAAKSILPGFEVKVARHLNKESLKEGDFKFSLSTIQQVLKEGTYILTDNAQADPRLREKKSVVLHQLKSILVVPLELENEVLGAVYLDHRYQPNCFKPEDVSLLTAFAAQSALAIQKARMMEELAAAKDKLEEKVKVQEEKIEFLTDELEHAREGLRYGYDEIIGKSPPMIKVFKLLDHVTETNIPVWILGESGTGKEMIATSLHVNSRRKNGPFITENVSAIPETLLESELFGHKKGSFTHADRDRVGLFEQATGGTLFLDEIADMSAAMQSKLLRVLQEGEVRPVGAGKKVKIDVRLVTASNKDLRQMVKAGKFRQDLFFRINGLMIPLPPLRERKEDIPLIAKHLIKKISREFGLDESSIDPEALRLLLRHPWPGNVRELEAVLRNALLFAKGKPISAKFISFSDSELTSTQTWSPAYADTSPVSASAPALGTDANERDMIVDALRKHRMSKEDAAKALSMSLRTLYSRMDQYKIPKKKTFLAKYLGLAG